MSATMVTSVTQKSYTASSTKRGGPSSFPSNASTNVDDEFQNAVIDFLSVKDRPFTVSGSIPILADDPLILFFRTSSGISHSLSFPLKTDSLNQLPALNVLLAACETSPDTPFDEPIPVTENTEHEMPLVWPAQFPFSTTFELANHPVLETVRSVLFPRSYPGAYLIAQRSQLEIILAGAHSELQLSSAPHGVDDASLVATILVTLPVRFRGGAIAVRNPDGVLERAVTPAHTVGSNGDTQVHWTAFPADCEHQIEFVEQGCRISIKYAVHLRTFGPVGPRPNPLFTPNDNLMDALSPVLNLARGRRLGIYLTGKYDSSPVDVLADSVVPSLKGSDAVLYHAMRHYKLTPELHWSTAGYIWPVDKTVQLAPRSDTPPLNVNYPYGSTPNSPQGRQSRQRRPSMARSAASYEDSASSTGRKSTSPRNTSERARSRSVIYGGEAEADDSDADLRDRIVGGGALPLRETDIILLTARDQKVSTAKVPFVTKSVLDKLFVNILMVTYVK